MSSPHEPVTSALLAALRTSGFAIGDHEAPVPVPDDEPYSILDHIPGGWAWGAALVDHTAGAALVYQTSTIGQRRDQAQALDDRLRELVLGRTAGGAYVTPITPVGLVVVDRDLDAFGGVDVEKEVVTVTSRYRLTVTPA